MSVAQDLPGPSPLLYAVTRDGKPVGTVFAHDGLSAIQCVQRATGGLCLGGWLASPVRESLAEVARRQVEDAYLEVVNDDARVASFTGVTIGRDCLFARPYMGNACYEPGRSPDQWAYVCAKAVAMYSPAPRFP